VNPIDNDAPTRDHTPDTVEMLRQLCERQTTEIRALQTRLKAATEANRRLSTEFVEESHRRQEALAQVIKVSEHEQRETEKAIKQRGVVVDALRALVGVVEPATVYANKATWNVREFATFRHAVELLKVIDDAKAAAEAAHTPA